jgi:hypothetical protein
MKTLTGALIVSAALAVQACASSNAPNPAQASALSEPTAVGEATVVTVRGWIDAIDKANRTITLKGPRGRTATPGVSIQDAPGHLEAGGDSVGYHRP